MSITVSHMPVSIKGCGRTGLVCSVYQSVSQVLATVLGTQQVFNKYALNEYPQAIFSILLLSEGRVYCCSAYHSGYLSLSPCKKTNNNNDKSSSVYVLLLFGEKELQYHSSKNLSPQKSFKLPFPEGLAVKGRPRISTNSLRDT